MAGGEALKAGRLQGSSFQASLILVPDVAAFIVSLVVLRMDGLCWSSHCGGILRVLL